MAPAPRIDVEAQLAPLGEREDLSGDEHVAAGLQGGERAAQEPGHESMEGAAVHELPRSVEPLAVDLQDEGADMVKTLAVHLAPIFNSNGVQPEALAALTLFRKAADQEKVTLDLAESLVAFLRKAQHDLELKFQSGRG